MQKLAFFRDAPAPWQGTPQGGPAITMEAMTMTMTETEALGIIRSITGISQQAGDTFRTTCAMDILQGIQPVLSLQRVNILR